MRNQLFRIVSVLLTLGWMALIFGFSAQTGEESGGMSAIFARPITEVIAAWQNMENTEALYQQVDTAVRSMAHFGEYAILGCLLTMALRRFGLKQWWLPWLIGVIYAVIDEWHQAFTPGRVSDAVDVAIDACGVLCGILFTSFIMNWRNKHV